MEENARQRTDKYIAARNQNPAWRLLASRRAPLVLGCLQSLFEKSTNGILQEDAFEALSHMLSAHANQPHYDIDPDNVQTLAAREIREWIKRRLIVEREGRIYSTDPLQLAISFADTLDNRFMTSTASRLSTVQREIENLEISLNPNPQSRADALRRRISELQRELEEAEAGRISVPDKADVVEGIREVFNLAAGLRADFRRVEDSWREADRALRHSIISEQYHRGEIVDRLLDDQDNLLATPEGRVFDGFQQQLRQSYELTLMSERLRIILDHPAANDALSRPQRQELRHLVPRLVGESKTVLQARSRSERDVRGFLKTGLAAEHHRVGQLLNDFFSLALQQEWQRAAVRRQDAPLPAIGIAVAATPAIERLRYKELDSDAQQALDMSNHAADLSQIGDDFWEAFDGLDRAELIQETLARLAAENRPLSLSELAAALPPVHDLETFAIWIGMAREADIAVIAEHTEQLILTDEAQRQWRFTLPWTQLEHQALKDINWEE